MNDKIKDILVGCLLGDAHIEKSGKNKAYITFEQTVKHKQYILNIYELLKSVEGLGLHDIKYYKRTDSRYKVVNESIYFKTHSSELLFPFLEMFLLNDKKILPLDIENLLNPITLAY
jgi:LAGLIDADG DNA endonuclease family